MKAFPSRDRKNHFSVFLSLMLLTIVEEFSMPVFMAFYYNNTPTIPDPHIVDDPSLDHFEYLRQIWPDEVQNL